MRYACSCISLCVVFICFAFASLAQRSSSIVFGSDTSKNNKYSKPVVIKKPKPLRTEMSFGLRLTSNGWGAFLDKGWVKKSDEKESDLFFDTKNVELEFDEVKHPKETKHTNTYLSQVTNDKPKPFIYGKINNFYTVKLGYGFRKMIAGKPEHGTVSMHWFGLGGLSIGLLKPYYIDAYVPQDNFGTLSRQSIKYDDSTKGAFLTDYLIIGHSGFSKGLNEMKIIPGLHVKTGLHCDFAASKHSVLAVEAGVNAEIYTQKIILMATQDAYPYNINVFASLQFGKRW
jgi:hypothetical protein